MAISIKRFHLVLCVSLLVGRWIPSFSQTSEQPWMIGLSYTLLDYQGPILGNYFDFKSMNPGGTVSAHTYINNALNLSINTFFSPDVVYPETEERFLETSLIDVNALISLKSNGTIFEEDAFFAPYIATGFGLNSASNINRVYVPAVFGVRLQITDKFGVNFQATYKQNLKSTDIQNMTFSGGVVFTLPTPEKTKKPKEKEDPRKDSDGDGVPDDIDKCPDVKGMQTYLGCPPPEQEKKEPAIDQTLETDTDMMDNQNDSDGLDEYRPISGQDRQFIQNAMNRIFFETASSNLLPSSYPTLDSVAMIMNRYPSMKLDVRGYTDNRGSYDINQVLSVMRAYEVKYYLVKQQGIKMRRITSNGYNQENPIASNETPEGRKLNRRVELHVVE